MGTAQTVPIFLSATDPGKAKFGSIMFRPRSHATVRNEQEDSMPSMSWTRQGAARRSCIAGIFSICLIGSLPFVRNANAQSSSSRPNASVSAGTGLLITGAVAQDLKLSLDDLKKMPHKSVSTKGHDDQMHQY